MQLVAQRIAMVKQLNLAVFWLITFLLKFSASAQNPAIQVTLGPDEIGENQAWTITVTVNNEQLRSYDNFPDINGMRKRGASTQSQTSIINGQMSSSQSVIMTYTPLQQGVITVPAFKMKVNEQIISVSGKKVKVGPAVQQRSTDPFRGLFDRDPFSDAYGRGETEFVEVKEDALLALSTTADEVYVGEGFTATLSFLVSESNRAPMQFHDLGKQLADILKKLRPANCWEENFNIENIEGEQVQIGGRNYTQYKLYRATFYPLNNQSVVFPSVGLEMIKFKVAKNPSFFGQNRQEAFKTFYSKPKTVKVRDLPAHPLRDGVAVGDYRLQEKITTAEVTTGESVAYEFSIGGEGNISAIDKPAVPPQTDFDIYDPNVRQNINREAGRVTGSKSFSYFLVPKEPGDYPLANLFQWIFFNPVKKKYDTLRSGITLRVTGESQHNQTIESVDAGTFYDQINQADNTLQANQRTDPMNWVVAVFLVLVAGLTTFVLVRKQA